MGTPTHVPWISLLGPGMSTSNGYYPVYLYYKKEQVLILAYGISETIEFEEPWTRDIINENKKISEFLEKPFRYGASYIFKSYQVEFVNNEVKFFYKEVLQKYLSNDLKIIVNKYKTCLEISVKDESSDLSKGLFIWNSNLRTL